MYECAVYPNGAIGGDAIKLEFEIFAMIGFVYFKTAAIPTNTTVLVPLR